MPLGKRQTLRPINRLAVIPCEFGPNGATRRYDPANCTSSLVIYGIVASITHKTPSGRM